MTRIRKVEPIGRPGGNMAQNDSGSLSRREFIRTSVAVNQRGSVTLRAELTD